MEMYSVVFNNQAEIILVEDDESIQSQAYNFLNIHEIRSLTDNVKMKTIDFIGIAHHCG
jgi:hypothetical protein